MICIIVGFEDLDEGVVYLVWVCLVWVWVLLELGLLFLWCWFDGFVVICDVIVV